MIPTTPILAEEITEVVYPSKTYKINFANHDSSTPQEDDKTTAILGVAKLSHMILGKNGVTTSSDRIGGYIDDLDAIKQAIYLILNTERYEHIIYSWDYGVELLDLIGQPIPYVISEVPRRIKDALTQDDRIDDVVDFEFEIDKHKLHTTFTVITNLGDISTELEVEV